MKEKHFRAVADEIANVYNLRKRNGTYRYGDKNYFVCGWSHDKKAAFVYIYEICCNWISHSTVYVKNVHDVIPNIEKSIKSLTECIQTRKINNLINEINRL